MTSYLSCTNLIERDLHKTLFISIDTDELFSATFYLDVVTNFINKRILKFSEKIIQ